MPVQAELQGDRRGCRERDGYSWCCRWSGRTARSSTPAQRTPTKTRLPPLGWQPSKSLLLLFVGILPGRFVCRTSTPLVELSWKLWRRNFCVKKVRTRCEENIIDLNLKKKPGGRKEKQVRRIPQPSLLRKIRIKKTNLINPDQLQRRQNRENNSGKFLVNLG